MPRFQVNPTGKGGLLPQVRVLAAAWLLRSSWTRVIAETQAGRGSDADTGFTHWHRAHSQTNNSYLLPRLVGRCIGIEFDSVTSLDLAYEAAEALDHAHGFRHFAS